MDNEIRYETSPLKAIKKKCIECFGGVQSEVKRCTGKTCPLYPFRYGTNPYRQRVTFSEERKAKLAENLKIAREKKSQTNTDEEQ